MKTRRIMNLGEKNERKPWEGSEDKSRKKNRTVNMKKKEGYNKMEVGCNCS